ncbi:HlyD family efflux transporter periplasmic adaptor subunit [Flavimaribacter sediminis]|nr:HlyD family secretion protein [Flavimaribacter sediminis]
MSKAPRQGNPRFLMILVAGVLAFLLYSAWIGGPYLRSVFIRDSAITTWKQLATAPIAGDIATPLPDIGTQVGPDTSAILIRNDRLFTQKNRVDDLEQRVNAIREQMAEAGQFLDQLHEMESARLGRRQAYARIFRQRLRREIAELKQDNAAQLTQITVLEELLERLKSAGSGTIVPQTRIDETALRLSELRQNQASKTAHLARAVEQLKFADSGHYQNYDGEVPAWALDDASDLRLQRLQMTMHRQELDSQARFLESELQSARADLARLSEAEVHVPAGATILSIESRTGAVVQPGQVVLTWVDCSELFVDVPVSDAETPLIHPGMNARVVIEGSGAPVGASVILVRGSAASLGPDDLAAIAKGRDPGRAQVLLSLEPDDLEVETCPIGQAAYVEFPDIGLIDIIRARMRL